MDEANGASQGLDTSVSTSGTPSPSPAPSAPVQTAEERVFRQSDVNDIVKKAKYGAVEDYKRLQSTQPDYAREKYGEQDQRPYSQPSSQSHLPNEDHYRKIAAEEAQRLRDSWVQEARTRSEADNAQRIVQSFFQKTLPGKEKYADFEKVTSDIEYARFPNVVQLLAEHIDNSHDLLYELGKDRIKMSNLEQLALMSPRDAIVQAQRLSQSIKDNETAGKVRVPNEPLSQLRPSNTGTDSGVMSVRDYRNRYKV